ncbi:MAG: hypothetical protein QM754_12325 [Tepidisphaeraceae bacterium]
MPAVHRPIQRFDFAPGRTVAGKYVIENFLGGGYEGEVYAIVEKNTGVRRAAKFYYPHRDPLGKSAIAYARKLDALRHCSILLQYHSQEIVTVQKNKVTVVVSELFEGEKLSDFLAEQPRGRLSAFEALHVLYALAAASRRSTPGANTTATSTKTTCSSAARASGLKCGWSISGISANPANAESGKTC